MRMPDIRPEFAQNVNSHIHRQARARGGKAHGDGARAGGLPQPRNQAAPDRAGQLGCVNRRSAGRGLMRDKGAQHRIFHSGTEPVLAGRMVDQLLMAEVRHGIPNDITHDVLAE